MTRASRRKNASIKRGNHPVVLWFGVVVAIIGLVLLWGNWIMFQMPNQSYQGDLPALTASELALRNALQADVTALTTDIGVRSYRYPEQLHAAELWIDETLKQFGYTVQAQPYLFRGQSYVNLAVEKVGTEKPDEIILVGGHYDSAANSPGANDNGTGAAAILELARLFAQKSTPRTLRFVAFTNEEPPFFWTPQMGSLVYAKQAKENNDNIVAMISLDTVGYYSDEAQSQRYPFSTNGIYPTQGNFIGFVGNLKSSGLVKEAIASFRTHTPFPSEGIALPGWVPGVGWSDHWSFWQQGYPGIMVTDTAPYRYPYYHTPNDTADHVDFEKLARMVNGLAHVIEDLAEA